MPQVYAVSGKLDISTAPMIKAPLMALRNRAIRNVIVMAGVQCLKTLIGELWLLWSIVNDPGPTQWLQPDNEDAKDHAKERFIPLIERFPAVHAFYSESRHDKTTAFIKFAHMFLRMEGAAAGGNLQRKSIKNQMRSEVWQVDKWSKGKLKEADSRMTQFVHNSKSYTESQPGWASVFDVDDMHGAYLAGDQCLINFACLECGKLQPFLWKHRRTDGTEAGMRWDVNERTQLENGQWRWAELVQTVRLECIHCGHRHYDDPITRRRITETLAHVPQNPDANPDTVSFCWNQLAMPNLSWFETKIGGVKNFLEAEAKAKRGDDKALRDFVMKVLAEPFDPTKHVAVADLETIELAGRGEESQSGPMEVQGIQFVHRLGSFDVQSDHFWVLIEIWSAGGDSLTLHAEKCYSWDELAERQKKFGVLDQNFSGDCSHRYHEVISECTRHGHPQKQQNGAVGWTCWKALRGSDQPDFIWSPKAGRDKGKRIQLPYTWPPETGDPCAGLPANDPRRREFAGKRCQVVTWSNPTIKDMVIARRDDKVKVESLVSRGDWNTEFNRQMHSQRKVPAPAKYGGDRWKWEKFRDDHLLDCKCMITVRALQLGLIGGSSSDATP